MHSNSGLARETLLRLALTLAGALLLWLAAGGVATAASAELQAMADRAVSRFRDAIEPPIQEVPYLCIIELEEGSPMRDFAIRSYGAAIQALLARADSPDNERRATRILRSIEHSGWTTDLDRWFAESAATDAAANRHASAQGELPAALDARMHANCGQKFLGRFGRTDKVLGSLAESDYRHAAELDPTDPWTWLVLAWLTEERGEPDLNRSLAAARARGGAEGLHIQMLAMLQLGHLREIQGRNGEADTALKAAVQLAAQAADATRSSPGDAQFGAARDLGRALSVLGVFQHRSGQLQEAHQTFSAVLPLRTQLAQARPDTLSVQLELVGTLGQLGLLDSKIQKNAPGGTPGHSQQALSLYKSLTERARYRPMIAESTRPGMIVAATTFAALATFVVGLVLLVMYRRRVARLMMAASSSARPPVTADGKEERFAKADIEIRSERAGSSSAGDRVSSSLFRSALAAQRRTMWVHLVAGLAFGLLAALLFLWAGDIDINANRLAICTWSWAWPTVIVLGLIWSGDRRRQWLVVAGYMAVLLLICLRVSLGETPPLQLFGITVPAFFQGLVMWLSWAAPSAVLLLFLSRSIRSIGPPLLAMMLTATFGGMLALIAASTPAGMELLTGIFSPLRVPVSLWMPATELFGMILAAPVAWWVATRMRALHAAKWMNDQTMVIDTIWLFQAFMLWREMAFDRGALAVVGLACFVLMKVIVVVGMRPAARAAQSRSPARLLLLRVFRRRRSSERLFDLLGARWRYAGPIHLIGAPDLATSTLDPDEFLDFLAGRLRQRFIIDPAELPERLAALDERCDPDGRYRVTEVYCGNDVWKGAVQGLMARSDLVAMDLRGFSPKNQGCLYELGTLLDHVAAKRIAFLVDQSTDQAFLRSALEAHMQRLSPESPNATDHAPGALSLVDTSSGEKFAVGFLLDMADRLAAAPA
jgi:hypothetical protein